MVYQYRSLDVSRKEIRLLTVRHTKDIAGEESGPDVSCELIHYSLGPHVVNPVYSALSYVWGSLSDTVEILVDGHRTSVTRNLYEALKQLSSESCGSLWVDALCINQQDMTERINQVLRMAEIYSRATLVISWLGVGQPADGAVFQLIDRLRREIEDRSYTKEELAEQSIDNPEWVAACQAMGRFCERPYWHRTWIIQEVALARKLEFRSGPFRCSAIWLFNAVDVSPFGTWGTLRTENWENVLTGDEYRAMETVRGLRNVKESMKDGGKPLLYYLWMASLMGSDSTDLRDRVYGMLGLATDAIELVPTPDYSASNPLRAMLTGLAREYVDRRVIFNILLCQNWNGRKDDMTPSWVPDFLNMSKSLPGHLAQLRLDLRLPFDCRQGFPRSVTNRVDIDGYTLSLHALLWDKVIALGEVREVQEVEPSFVDITMSTARLDLSSTTSNHPTGMVSTSRNPYNSEVEEYRAILAAIQRRSSISESCDWIGVALCNMWDQSEDFHRALLRSGDTHTAADAMAWLRQNSSFQIRGRSLREWTEQHRDGYLQNSSGRGNETGLSREYPPSRMTELQRTLSANYYSRRRLAFTEEGFVGNVHGCTKIGDKIAISCFNVPVLLRERLGTESVSFELVGDAYISGMMWGEKRATIANADDWKLIEVI